VAGAMTIEFETGRPSSAVVALWARFQQDVGSAGLAGIALILSATVVFASGWWAQREFDARVVLAPRPFGQASARTPGTADVGNERLPDLPKSDEAPLLLTGMEQAAVSGGLEWRSGEYRIVAATGSSPATLEARCTLRGSYPKVRAALVRMLTTIPFFTIRAFDVKRPNSDTADVDAKLVLAVFLADDSVSIGAMGKASP